MTGQHIKVNAIARSFGTALIKSGINMIKSGVDFTSMVSGPRIINDALQNKGINIPISQLDVNYYYTSWDNWKKIIEVLYGIIKDFKWEADKADCDDRSNLMTSLCSIIFGINTCGGLYCEVYDAGSNKLKYLHWANLIITSSGEIHLFDVDQSGQTTKVSSQPVIMGNNKYVFKQLRIY